MLIVNGSDEAYSDIWTRMVASRYENITGYSVTEIRMLRWTSRVTREDYIRN